MLFYNKICIGGNNLLRSILSLEECANCRICCSFDSSDLWETPVICKELADLIVKNIYPDQEFLPKDGDFLLKLDCEPDEDLYYCTMLDRECGCKLHDTKPFDCKIWPFRVMNFNDTRVITLSPVCPVMLKKPLDQLYYLAKELAPIIFNQADRFPSIVKPYIHGYPILFTEAKTINL